MHRPHRSVPGRCVQLLNDLDSVEGHPVVVRKDGAIRDLAFSAAQYGGYAVLRRQLPVASTIRSAGVRVIASWKPSIAQAAMRRGQMQNAVAFGQLLLQMLGDEPGSNAQIPAPRRKRQKSSFRGVPISA